MNIRLLTLNKLFVCTLLLFSMSALPDIAYSQNIKFEHLPPNLGLSRRSVRAIVQDNNGFIWLGTSDGLLRFDGYSTKAYKNKLKDTNSISDNNIRTLYKDSQGDLWIGIQGGGLNHFDIETEKVTRYRHDTNDSKSLGGDDVWCITEDPEGDIWIGTWSNGLGHFDRKTKVFTTYRNNPKDKSTIGNGPIWDIMADEDGNIWAAIDGSGLNKFNKSTKSFTRYIHEDNTTNSISDNAGYALTKDSKGSIWIATKNGNLNRFNPSTEVFQSIKLSTGDVEGITEFPIYKILEVNTNELWIATGVGLQILNPITEKLKIYQYDPGDIFSLSNNNVLTIYQDNTSLIWIGNEDGGVNKVLERKKFKHYTSDPKVATSLSFKTVRSLGQDEEGNLWIGTQGGGLNKFDEENGVFKKINIDDGETQSIDSEEISAIFEDSENRFWVGTWGDGLKMRYKDSPTFKHFKHNSSDTTSLSSNFIQFIYQDSRGIIWVGTEKGLNRLLENGEWKNYFHISDDSTTINANNFQSKAIAEDREGYLWLGTWKGLNKYDRTTDSFTSWSSEGTNLSNEHIISIFDDNKGNLWLGTFGGGVNKFNKTTEEFTIYSDTDGLPNNVVFGVLDDDKGNLWFSTNNGLSRFNPEQNTFQNYTESDGLQGNEFYWGGSLKLKDGRLVFGGVNGFNIFNPDSIVNNPNLPPVEIVAIRKYGKEEAFSEALHQLDTIVLSYQENFFSIEFAALNYIDTRKNQYAYKLVGFQDEWIYSGNRREASFTNLEGGTYTFMVKASNNDNLWNETPTTLTIVIVPPIWEEKWFQALIVVLFLLGVFVVYRVRVNAIEKQKQRLERKVEKRTAELREANDSLHKQKTEIETQAEELAQQRDNLTNANDTINKRLNDIKTLSDIGQKVTASIDIKEVIATIYTSVNELMDAPNFEIGIIDWETRQIEYYGYHDKNTSMQHGYSSVNTKGTLTNWSIENQKEILISNVEEEIKEYVSEELVLKYKDAKAKSIIYIPLVIEGLMMGVMITKSFQKNAYTDIQLQLLRNMASYISIALSNANAYHEIDKNHAMMKDSIQYAQTIQNAFLPPSSEFEKCFAQHFIIYKPKDIVSGDFYWLSQTEEYSFVAVVDCTGHGVPGAFMSLIGNSLLNRIVNEQDVYQPAEILVKLNEGVKRALRQEESSNDDGMDMILCRFNRKDADTTIMTYAGAKGNIFVCKDGELLRLKTSRKSIGGQFYGKNTEYDQDTISLTREDGVYLLSDGIIDAVNPNRKRFGTLKFKKLIQEVKHLPFKEQEIVIKETLETYKEGTKQRDDISILGVSI